MNGLSIKIPDSKAKNKNQDGSARRGIQINIKDNK